MPDRTFGVSISAMKRRARVWLTARRLINQWHGLRSESEIQRENRHIGRVVIIPSDPSTLVGAKGDEAMILAAVNRLASAADGLTVGILTATPSASEAARALGFVALQVWVQPWSLSLVHSVVSDFRPDAILVVGADVLDGFYDPLMAMQMLIVADLAVRRGARGSILGFSLNQRPSRYLGQVFDELTPGLQVNVRDELSLGRFRHFSKAQARLTADIAFLLKPDPLSSRVQEVCRWVTERREQGSVVIGLNVHPMLIHGNSSNGVLSLISSTREALRRLLCSRRLAVVLLAHDYRGNLGDDACLRPIYEGMKGEFDRNLLYPSDPMSAAELKAIAGSLDGLLTGRMHLAIAGLGMGIPIAALTYQDKFEGLLRHFNLPNKLLLDPLLATDPRQLVSFVSDFIERLSELRSTVRLSLEGVMEAAEQNLPTAQ